VVHFNGLKPCAEGMRFEDPIESPSVSNSQELQLPVNSPLINDDCFDDACAVSEDNTVSASDDDNVPTISALAHEGNLAGSEETQDYLILQQMK